MRLMIICSGRSVSRIVLLQHLHHSRPESCVSWGSLRSGFRKLLEPGLDTRSEFHRVILATTMWSGAEDEIKTHKQFEQDWRALTKRGAKLWKCTHTSDFTKAAINDLLTVRCGTQVTPLVLIKLLGPTLRNNNNRKLSNCRVRDHHVFR